MLMTIYLTLICIALRHGAIERIIERRAQTVYNEKKSEMSHDFFDDVINIEDRLSETGYRDGKQQGSERGHRDGYAMGYEHGFALGSELAYYAAFVFMVREAASLRPDVYSARYMRVCCILFDEHFEISLCRLRVATKKTKGV